MANYCFDGLANFTPQAGDVIEGKNFMQLFPHTAIPNVPVVFRNCNLVNCDIPNGSMEEGCLHIQVDFCSHIHPELVERGLAECGAECRHMASKEEIVIDGIVVDCIYSYEDKGAA
jgi:hypothetical protein